MPKKRIKQSGNVSKSGTLTQNFRKELKVDSHLNNFILRDVFHSQNKKNLDKFIFNDSRTIVFNSKVVNATLGIEKSYIEGDYLENNKLVNTPNLLDHDSTYEVTKIVRPEDYSHVLYSNYENELDEDIYTSFSEDFIDYENIFSKNSSDLVDQTTTFEEIGYNFKKNIYEIKRNFEEINISFNKDIINLSFNLNNTVTEYTTPTKNSEKDLPYVKFPRVDKNYSGNINVNDDWSFLALNNNTIYLDKNVTNNQQNFYCLHDPKINYFSSNTIFNDYAPITNHPFTKYPDDIIGAVLDSTNPNNGNSKAMYSLNSISNPIAEFGFPFDKRYRGNNEVTVPLSDYISEDFILEKVYVEFDIKNFAISNDEFTPCINFLNFFILNQRKFVDTNSDVFMNSYYSDNDMIYQNRWLNGSLSQISHVKYFDNDTSTGNYKLTRISSPEPFQESQFNAGRIIPPLYYWIDDELTYPTSELSFSNHCHRELITNIKIANIGNIISEDVESNENYFMTLNGADAIIRSDVKNTDLTSWEGQSVYDNILTDWKKVKITSKIKNYNKNKKLKKFSNFEIYPKQSNKRSGVDIQSERSIESELEINIDYGTPDDNGIRFDLGSVNYVENPYVVKPTDELIFGFNFTPNMLLSDEDPVTNTNNKYVNLTGRDVISLSLNRLKIKLFGRYVRENKAFVPKKSEFENKNIKKINEFCTNVVDKIGLPSPYLLKGAYYNSFANSPIHPNGISTDWRRFGNFLNIPQDTLIEFPYNWWYTNNGVGPLNSDMWQYTPEDTITNSVRSNFSRLDDYTGSYLNRALYYRYNVDHFGFISDKINHNRHYAYIDVETGKTSFNVKKIFRKDGLFLQKDESAGDVINSYNKDKNSALSDVKFTDVSSTT